MEASAIELFEKLFAEPELQAPIRAALQPEIKPMALYTYSQVVVLTQVSYATVKRAVEAGHLHADYIGSEPRIKGRAIFQWLRDGGKTGRSVRNLIEEKQCA